MNFVGGTIDVLGSLPDIVVDSRELGLVHPLGSHDPGHTAQREYYQGSAHHVVVLDILVQARRDANAAKRFFRRVLKGLQYVPRVIVTE